MRIRRFMAVFTVLIIILLFTGCSRETELMSIRIAYAASPPFSTNKQAIQYVTRNIAITDGERLCRMALQLASNDPAEDTLTTVFPRRLTLLSVDISEKGIITVDFGEAYASLTGISRTLADYCTVLTLFDLDSIDDIKITGVVIKVNGENESMVMTPDNIILGTDILRLREHSFKIYLPNNDKTGLSEEVFKETISDAQEQAEVIVSLLIAGKREDGTLNPVVNKETYLIELYVKNRICYVNLNSSFIDLQVISPNGENLTVYAFVNSLCTLSYIDRVQFLIEGERVTLNSTPDFDSLLPPNIGLIKD